MRLVASSVPPARPVPPFAGHPDAALLALEQKHLAAAADVHAASDDVPVWEAALDAIDAVEAEIAATRATTLDGLRLKARIATRDDRDSTRGIMSESILRDLSRLDGSPESRRAPCAGGSDAALILLGQTFDDALETCQTRDAGCKAFDALGAIIDKIVATPATTPAGLAVKAKAVAYMHRLDIESSAAGEMSRRAIDALVADAVQFAVQPQPEPPAGQAALAA